MTMQQTDVGTADILIVDDTPQNLRLLSTILTQAGYCVRQAISGQVAIAAAQASPPDLILLDVMMPGMDGYEVCQHLKANQHTAKIPIIFLSALSEGTNKSKAFLAGGTDYVTKPFQMEEVIARVQYQLVLKAANDKIHQLNVELEQRVKERTSQLELANAQLLKMAMHDGLTGLPNRAFFLQQLEYALNQTKENSSYLFAVLFLDCDRFKVINDSLGHLIGDELLVAIAQRLVTSLQRLPQDVTDKYEAWCVAHSSCHAAAESHNRPVLARLGGDEFAFFLPNIQSIENAAHIAGYILETLSRPFQLARYEVFITASIGIALGNSQYDQPEQILRDADTAMYHAKNSGKSQYKAFNPSMHEAAIQLLQFETDLRRAVRQQELTVHYQPIISIDTGEIAGFEALVRWCHPERGLISPGSFIPIAEETGLVSQIGYFVLKEACNQLRLWQQQRVADASLSMSVNLSVRQFAQPDLIQQVDRILSETQLNPACLTLEITESAIMENSESATQMLQELRERHIQLSIDDFGTGYSSLSYLHSLPIDILKIDRSFVQFLDNQSKHAGLVPVIITIAQALGIRVVAEGIETRSQLEQLRTLQCNLGQGFLFSKPLEAEKITQLLMTNPQW